MTINNELLCNYLRIWKSLRGNCKTSYISSQEKKKKKKNHVFAFFFLTPHQ